MKRTLILLSLGAVLALSAAAQTYSQPVRDINDPGKNAVTASCYFGWSNSTGHNSCTVYTVPAGKRLIVRDVSVSCTMAAANDIPYASLNQQGGLRTLYMPMSQIELTDPALRFKTGGRAMFYVADAGGLSVSAWLVGQFTVQPSCVATIFGHLAEAQ